MFGAIVFLFPSHHCALLSWGWLNACLTMDKVNEFLILLYLFNWLYPTGFLTFTLPILSLSPPKGNKQVAEWGSVAAWG